MNKYEFILSQNHTARFGYKDNANILVLGQVGSYKTRGHILPNIMHQNDISMVISDAKGELLEKTGKLLRQKGYTVQCINFDVPASSINYFNPFAYISTPEDILAISNILVSEVNGILPPDPYWDNASQLLLNAVIAYMVEECPPTERTLTNLRKLICALKLSDNPIYHSPLEIIFNDLRKKKPWCYAIKQWDAFIAVKDAVKTASCIVSVLLTKFAQFLTPDIEKLTTRDTVKIDRLGSQKTALFICVSDVDRSKDKLVSIFYRTLLSRLRTVADQQASKGLPVHVHCFLDDFATNVVIPEFDNYISCLRSREISFTLVLQSESQLAKRYGPSRDTIIANCAYYLFLGSRDLGGCLDISKRMNLPLNRILYKPRDEVLIIRNFEKPLVDRIYDVRSHPNYKELEHDTFVNTYHTR